MYVSECDKLSLLSDNQAKTELTTYWIIDAAIFVLAHSNKLRNISKAFSLAYFCF